MRCSRALSSRFCLGFFVRLTCFAVFVIDIGVPRNVDPQVDELDAVFRYDIDDLTAVADENADERRREQVQAEAIVVEEQQNFDGWFSALRAVPTINMIAAQT